MAVFRYLVGGSLPLESGLAEGLSGVIVAALWCFSTIRNWLPVVPPEGALPKQYLWILVNIRRYVSKQVPMCSGSVLGSWRVELWM